MMFVVVFFWLCLLHGGSWFCFRMDQSMDAEIDLIYMEGAFVFFVIR